MYGKISTFPKKEAAFQRWAQGESFADIAKNFKVAEATAEIYTLDMIASGRGEVTMVNTLLKELEIEEEPFARVEEHLTRRNVTLWEIFDSNDLRYNQIRAVIVALMFDVHPYWSKMNYIVWSY